MLFNLKSKQTYEDGTDHAATFHYLDLSGELCSDTLRCNLFEGKQVMPTHYISCRHHEGKVWESLYVPANGAEGLAVTRWARNGSSSGSFNVKKVSELEWYNTVKSKAVLKGYDVLHITGVTTPLTSRHSFIQDLRQKGVLLPNLSMPYELYSALKPNDRSSLIAKAYRRYKPISHFLNRLCVTGIDKAIASNLAGRNDAELILEQALGLQPQMATATATQPTRAETRAERYGMAWGAFG